MRFASNSGMQSSWQRRRGAGLVILALAAMLCGVPRVTARPSWQDSSTKAALQTAQDKKGKADAQKQARKERAAEEANQLPAGSASPFVHWNRLAGGVHAEWTGRPRQVV